MSESIILPIAVASRTAAPAESVEGDEAASSDFTIEDLLPDLPAGEQAVDVPVTDLPVQDRLQLLVEELSGITSALRPTSPDRGEAGMPDMAGLTTLPSVGRISSGPTTQTVVALPADPTLATAALPDLATVQPEATLAEPAPLSAPAPREAGAVAPQPASHRVPAALVARQIAETVVTARDDRIEIALSPEELGRIRMVMSGPEHSPHVMIWAERPEVLDQLRRNVALLQEFLGDAGMAAPSFEFQDGSGDGTGSGGQSLPGSLWTGNDITDTADIIALPAAWRPLAAPVRLDIRI